MALFRRPLSKTGHESFGLIRFPVHAGFFLFHVLNYTAEAPPVYPPARPGEAE